MRIHFLYCPFTGLGYYQGYRGLRWLKNRIKIFKQFVIPSLLNQTRKEFIVLISWRKEDKKNPIIQDFKNNLNSIRGITFVHTFHGILFWDDKYEDSEAEKRLRDSLEATLPEISSFIPKDCNVAMSIQPSDDLYYYKFVEKISDQEFDGGKAVGFKRGYIINYLTKEIKEYDPDTSPPFYTIFFTREIFLNPQKHFEYTGKIKSHEYVKEHIDMTFFEERGFMVGTHGENISTYFGHPFSGQKIEKSEKERILVNFGIWDTEFLDIKNSWRKKLLHRIPHFWQKKIRYFIGEKLYTRYYDWIRK